MKKLLIAMMFFVAAPCHAGWVEQNAFDPEYLPRDVFFLDTNTGWVAGAYQGLGGLGPNAQQIFKTTDGGATWVPQLLPGDQEEGNISQLFAVYFHDVNSGWVGGRSGPPANELQMRATADGGTSWNKVNLGGGNNIQDIHATSANDVWAVGDWDKVFHSTDGGQTFSEQTVTGLASTQIWNIEMPTSSVGYIATPADGQIFKTTDGGSNWSEVFTAPSGANSLDFLDENTGWVGSFYDSTIWKTTDGGSTWTDYTIPTSLVLPQIASISFFDELNGAALIPGELGEIWGTVDGGETWTLEHIVEDPGFSSIQLTAADDGWFVGTRTIGGSSITQELGLKSQGLFLSAASTSGLVLRYDPNAPVNFSMAGIPEPSTMWLCVLALGFAVIRRRP